MKMKKILVPLRGLIPLRMSISYPANIKTALKNCEQNENTPITKIGKSKTVLNGKRNRAKSERYSQYMNTQNWFGMPAGGSSTIDELFRCGTDASV